MTGHLDGSGKDGNLNKRNERSDAAHSRPLNGALKGNAFWWMLACLSGWEPKK